MAGIVAVLAVVGFIAAQLLVLDVLVRRDRRRKRQTVAQPQPSAILAERAADLARIRRHYN